MLADEVRRYHAQIAQLEKIRDALKVAKQQEIEPLREEYNALYKRWNSAQQENTEACAKISKTHNDQIAEHETRVKGIVTRINTRPRDASFFFWLDADLEFSLMFESLMNPLPGQRAVVVRSIRGKGRYGNDYGQVFMYEVARHSRVKKKLIWKKVETYIDDRSTTFSNALVSAVKRAAKNQVPIVLDVRQNDRVVPVPVTDVVVLLPKPTTEYYTDAETGVYTHHKVHHGFIVASKQAAERIESATHYHWGGGVYPSGLFGR